jgi:hypothetical protein
MQLDPVGGDSIIDSILNGSTIGNLLRKFKLIQLKQQMRSIDIYHTKIIDLLSDPMKHMKPITPALLKTTCDKCLLSNGKRKSSPTDHLANSNCPIDCPHRCQHFKELNEADIENDNEWDSAIYVSCTNQTVDRINTQCAINLSKRTGHPIIKWRHPPSTSEFRNVKVETFDISDEYLVSYNDMWCTFIKGAPAKITFNMNVSRQIANGTQCKLHSLLWFNKSEEPDFSNYTNGQILTVTIRPDIVYVELNESQWGVVDSIIEQKDSEQNGITGPVIALEVDPKISDTRGKRRQKVIYFVLLIFLILLINTIL